MLILKHACVLMVVCGTVGCSVNRAKDEQLSEVAKGWCRTIRASQVIPVYPLTEDVQAGDIFVVQRPIEDEVELYNEAGFLPLGQHLGRLSPSQYSKFYAGGEYGLTPGSLVPGVWRQPSTLPTTRPANEQSGMTPSTQPARHSGSTNWPAAPRAAFPSYSFDIDQSAGLRASLPIQGLPLALGIVGSNKASATVTLNDAYTYGVDISSLNDDLAKWIAENREKLKMYQPGWISDDKDDGVYRFRYNYLRVVTKVYLVGRVNVSVVNSSGRGGDANLGVAQNLNLFNSNGNFQEDLQSLTSTLTSLASGPTTKPVKPKKTKPASRPGIEVPASQPDTAEDADESAGVNPGVRFRFLSITRQSVSLDETFDRPLVVGYIAYDLPILLDGQVASQPVSTAVRLRFGGLGSREELVRNWIENDPRSRSQIDDFLVTYADVLKAEDITPAPTAAEIEEHFRQTGKLTWKLVRLFHKPNQKWQKIGHLLLAYVVESPVGVYHAEKVQDFASSTQPAAMPNFSTTTRPVAATRPSDIKRQSR